MHQTVGPYGDDEGALEKTGRGHDRGFFRTPSLRNVMVTGPYLRDGRADTLRAAIEGHPAELTFSAEDLSVLEAFLASLTDQSFLTDPRFSAPSRACG
jgi:cytochrome c peroxidase